MCVCVYTYCIQTALCAGVCVLNENLSVLVRNLQHYPQFLNTTTDGHAQRVRLGFTSLQLKQSTCTFNHLSKTKHQQIWQQLNEPLEEDLVVSRQQLLSNVCVLCTCCSSTLSELMFSKERQKASSSSHTASFSNVLSGSCSRSSINAVIWRFISTNSAWRCSCKQTWPYWLISPTQTHF